MRLDSAQPPIATVRLGLEWVKMAAFARRSQDIAARCRWRICSKAAVPRRWSWNNDRLREF